MREPTPTILRWFSRYDGETPDGQSLWWAQVAWDGDDRHVTAVETAPPEERQPDWVWDTDMQGYRIAEREDGNDDHK